MLNRFRVGMGLRTALSLCLTLGLVLAGCGASDTPSPEETVLIRTDRQTVTKGQFERAFEAAKIAYSDNRRVDHRTPGRGAGDRP
jgi:hypothetical protein